MSGSVDSFTPDGIILGILTTIGLPAGAVTCFAIALAVSGWKDTIHTAVEVTRKLGDLIEDARQARIPSGIGTTGAVFVTAMVAAGQMLLLTVWYSLGAWADLLLDHDRFQRLQQTLQADGLRSMLGEFFAPSTPACVGALAGLIALVTAYRRSIAGEDPGAVARVAAAPGSAVMWLAFASAKLTAALMGLSFVFMLLALATKGSGPDSTTASGTGNIAAALVPLGFLAGVTAVGGFYKAACEVGVRASEVVVDVWWRDPHAEHPRFVDLLGDWPWQW